MAYASWKSKDSARTTSFDYGWRHQQNVRARTQFFVEWMALDIVRDASGAVLGVTALEMETGEVVLFQAKATLFATGGAGRIFWATTNAFINTGDGIGAAARAGIPLEDMEFWQFHPTGVAGPQNPKTP